MFILAEHAARGAACRKNLGIGDTYLVTEMWG